MVLLRLPLIAALVSCAGSEPPPPAPDTSDTVIAPVPPSEPGPTSSAAEPLSALSSVLHATYPTIVVVSWTQAADAAVHVDFSFDPEEWVSSPIRQLGAGDHQELLLGVPFGVEVTWRVIAEVTDGAVVTSPDHTIQTPETPVTIPPPVVSIADETGWDTDSPYLYLSLVEKNGDFGGRWWALIIDRAGRTVWGDRSTADTIHMHPRLSWNEDALLLDANSYWGAFDGGVNSTVTKMFIDGTVIDFWDTPGLHHPYTDLPDGSLAYGSMVWPGYQDEFLVVLHPDGTEDVLFSCDTFLKDIGEGNDSCGSNTLTYDPVTDTFLLSLFTVETIVEVDATTGAVDTWFGHVKGSWAFDPPDSAFWYQHGGYYTPEGTLLTSTHTEQRPDGGETVTREYALDEVNQTLVEVWNFGVGDGVYGDQMGEAHRLPNGNVLQNYGTLARVREGKPDGTIVWDVWWPTSSNIGRSVPIKDLYALAPPRP